MRGAIDRCRSPSRQDRVSGVQILTFDFGASRLTVDSVAPGSIITNAIFTFRDLTSPLTPFSLVSQTGFTGYVAANTTLGNGTFSLNLRGTNNLAGDRLVLAFGGAVPEPASWAMMILGAGAAGVAMRRRQSARMVAAA